MMRSSATFGSRSLPVVSKKLGGSTASTRIVLTSRSEAKVAKPRNAAVYGTGYSSRIDGPGRLKPHRSTAMPDSARL
jgi:hypothetical protein